MRVRQQASSQKFLEVSSNFATLIDIEPDGTFVYEISYRAAVVRALRANINRVRISVHKTQPVIGPPLIPTIDNPTDFRKIPRDILLADARRKDLSRLTEATKIAQVEDDFSRGFNSELSRNLSRDDIPEETFMGTSRVFDLRSVAELESENYDAPALQTSAGALANLADTQRSVQEASLTLLSNGIDPSVMSDPLPCVIGTFSAFSGLNQLNRSPSFNTVGTSNKLDQARNNILHSLMGTSLTSVRPRVDLNTPDLVPVVADVPITLVNQKKLIRVPQEQVGFDDFFVLFEMEDIQGQQLARLTRRLSHNILVRLFNTPFVAPTFQIAPFQFPGRNVLELTQNDNRAEKIRIERRTIRKNDLEMIDNSYELLAEIPIKKEDGLIKFVDIVNNFNFIQYRAIPIGPGGILGAVFTNAVSPAIKQGSSDIGFKPRPRGAAIDVGNTQGGLEIVVTNVAADVIAVAITRRDETLNETESEIIDVIRPIRLVTGGLARARFIDDDVTAEHIYEYGCRLYYEDGLELDSTASVLHKYIELSIGTAIVDIQDVRVTRDNQGVDVQFRVQSEITENNLDVVKLALEQQGLDRLFIEDLTNERDRLQQLIAHSIERINLTTGQREDFGTFTGVAFSDKREGARTGVSPLKDGRLYRYVVTTLLRDAETLFENLAKTRSDPTTGKAYAFSPFKFKHPLALSRGTLVDRQTLKSNHPEDDFGFGKVGNPREIDVDIALAPPRISDVNVCRVGNGRVCLRWKLDGARRRLEHFVITKELLGMKSIAGKVHHVSPTGTFEFFDHVTADDIGEVSYRITPIYNDYTWGSTSNPKSLVIRDGRL